MTGTVAIVTGAARGVGRAVVSRLHGDGWRVVAVDIAESVSDLPPDRILAVRADAGLEQTAVGVVRAAIERFGRLDLLVNNAARFLKKPITQCSADDWDAIVGLNARGPFLWSREALPELVRTNGAIVNVASTAGVVGLLNQTVYGAAKAALIQLTRSLAIEAAPRVRVNAVAPGGIDTHFADEANRDDPDPAARAARILASYPLGRFCTAAEVAEAIVFLGSSAASGITGTILSVDGGYVAR